MSRNTRFRRRPNNSGTVVKLSGKRRKPYCARILSEERDIITGAKKQVSIGTFETREEALNALAVYSLTKEKKITDQEGESLMPDLFRQIQNRTQKKMPTFGEIYEIIDEQEFSKLTKESRRNYRGSFKRLSVLTDRKINTISLNDMQDIFDSMKDGFSSQARMKTICVKIFEYAVAHQYIRKDDDYTNYIKIKTLEKSTMHRAFTIEEINKLKELDTPEAHVLLIYIYTGCRMSELLGINRANIHIDEQCNDDGVERKISYIVTGCKTDAGRNRIIPIHNDIKEYVIEELIGKKERLFDAKRTWFYMSVLYKANKELGFEHKMHDTRETFASLCQLNNINIYIRKKVMGHKMNDITFDVYTNASKNRLWTEINKIRI